METLNSRDPIDLWESWDNGGKLHINYDVCVNTSIFSIYGVQRLEECIIVSPETIFVLYEEQTLFSSILTLRNFKSMVGKNYF
jgi:hypothetical protein